MAVGQPGQISDASMAHADTWAVLPNDSVVCAGLGSPKRPDKFCWQSAQAMAVRSHDYITKHAVLAPVCAGVLNCCRTSRSTNNNRVVRVSSCCHTSSSTKLELGHG